MICRTIRPAPHHPPRPAPGPTPPPPDDPGLDELVRVIAAEFRCASDPWTEPGPDGRLILTREGSYALRLAAALRDLGLPDPDPA